MLGLYDLDDEWNACLEEVVGMQRSVRLRSMFVTILAFGVLGELRMLWDKYKVALQRCDIMESSIEQIESWALHSLQDALAKSSKMFKDFGLLAPFVAFDWL